MRVLPVVAAVIASSIVASSVAGLVADDADGVAAAQPLPASRSKRGKLLKGPYLQNVAPTSMTVMWELARRGPAEIRVVGGPDRSERVIASPIASSHEVVIDGLAPASRYRYWVTAAGETAEGEFATAPELGAQVPLTFVVYGDSRSNVDSHRRVIERIAAEVPDFMLGTGDMVDDGGRANEWQWFFDIEGELLRDNVLFPAVGNHDRQGRGRTADNYRQVFAVPENSPDPERYYAFTYGSARFLILDSNSYSFALTDQTAWLEAELQSARQDPAVRQIFVTMHHPPFSVSLHGGQRDLRERWTPLFEKYQVTAVFSGHDHVYSRAEKNGVHYFVSGGGGAPLYPKAPRPNPIDVAATKYFERVNHFLRVHTYGDFVEISAVRADGTPIETVAWGERPTSPPPAPAPVVAIAAAGAGSAKASRKAAAGDVEIAEPAVDPARELDVETAVSEPSATVSAGASDAPVRGGGLGWLAKAGIVVALIAGIGLWRALRG